MMKKYKDDFCFFILSYKRPNNIKTLNTLKKLNYSGKWYIIVDDSDETIEQYKELYKDHVIVFNKKEVSKKFDVGDNFSNMKAVVYARNVTFEIAKKLDIKYFMQLDDDYVSFYFKLDQNGEITKKPKIKNFDGVIESTIDYFITGNFDCLAYSQNGDFIGGNESSFLTEGFSLKRKAMNTMLCATDKPFQFVGKINEDVNAYVFNGSQGKLFGTVNFICVQQVQTQKNKGGLTDIYLDSGTYVKSFYSILYNPSCVKISKLGNTNPRIHHKINWNCAVPKIVDEKYKKRW